MDHSPDIIYLGRARLHRGRANLIQTLHTSSAFVQLGFSVRLVLPPWHRQDSMDSVLKKLDIDPAPVIKGSRLLHPRWGFWPYVRVHCKSLSRAKALYTRVVAISLLLCRAELSHSLEIHNVESLQKSTMLQDIVDYQQKGVIRCLIPISHGAAKILVAAGADPDRIHVAHSGVKLAGYGDLADFDPAALTRPRIVHLGRFSENRGLKIFQALAENKECSITVVSSDRLDLPGIDYHPPVPLSEVPRWYGQSDITLLPYQPAISTAASMSPVKLFEALAAGRPIIASDLPTIREVLQNEKNALLVKPDDVDAWGAAIRRLQKDHLLAVRLAKNARQSAEKYSWEVRAKGIATAIGLLESE